MRYCTYCGKEQKEGEGCACAQARKDGEKKGKAGPEKKQPLLSDPMKTGLKGVLRGMVSRRPVAALHAALQSKAPLYVVFGALYCIAMGLAGAVIPGQLLGRGLGNFTGFVSPSAVNRLLPVGTLFFMWVLLGLMILLCSFLLVELVHLACRQRVSLGVVMNMVSAAFFPLTLVLLAAVACAFFAPPVSMLLLLAGPGFTLLLTYEGMRLESSDGKAPFWSFLLAYTLLLLLIVLFLYRFMLPYVIASAGSRLEFPFLQ